QIGLQHLDRRELRRQLAQAVDASCHDHLWGAGCAEEAHHLLTDAAGRAGDQRGREGVGGGHPASLGPAREAAIVIAAPETGAGLPNADQWLLCGVPVMPPLALRRACERASALATSASCSWRSFSSARS